MTSDNISQMFDGVTSILQKDVVQKKCIDMLQSTLLASLFCILDGWLREFKENEYVLLVIMRVRIEIVQLHSDLLINQCLRYDLRYN